MNLAYASYRCKETSTKPFASGNYTKYISTKKVVFDFGNTLVKNVTCTGLGIILGKVLGAAVGASVGGPAGAAIGGKVGGVAGTIAGILISELKSTAKRYCPTSTSAGCNLHKYELNSSKSCSIDRYYMYKGDYYANYKNGSLSHYVDTCNFYEHNYFC